MKPFGLVLVLALLGCGGVESAPRCELGRVQSCPCVGGGQGAQECGALGVWSPCVCTGSDAGADVSPSADVDASSDAGRDALLVDGAPAPRLYESCDLGGDCGAGLECLAVPGLDGGTRGVCSVRCTTDFGCPGPGLLHALCGDGMCLVNCARGPTGNDPSVCASDQRCVRMMFGLGPNGPRCVP